MTEAEWLACTDPTKMLQFLRGRASDRKLRLFAVACCRAMGHRLADERSRKAVEVAARLGEGVATEQERTAAWAEAACVSDHHAAGPIDAHAHAAEAAVAAVASSARVAACDVTECFRAACTPDERSLPCRFLQCIFGPLPFRPIPLDASWLTFNVKQLAVAIYEGRTFERLPNLADALQEAGCTDTEILAHCRAPGRHVRGCWAIDLLLSKDR